jgi:hypothetical protein
MKIDPSRLIRFRGIIIEKRLYSSTLLLYEITSLAGKQAKSQTNFRNAVQIKTSIAKPCLKKGIKE